MKRKTVFAFGRIRDSVKYRLKFAHFPYLAKALLRERAHTSEGLTILDVGCGPGNIAAFCGVPAGSKWFGVDLWENQLRQAADKGIYENLFQVNLLDGLPFRDRSFDMVICNEVLMYLPNSQEVLGEFHRVLRPEGKVFVYNPISWFPKILAGVKNLVRKVHQEKDSIALDTQTGWKNSRRPCRINYYSFRSLIDEIRSARFQVTEVTAFRLLRNRVRLLTRLENYRWYYRMTSYLARRFPFLACDIMVAGCKKEAAPAPARAIRQRAAA